MQSIGLALLRKSLRGEQRLWKIWWIWGTIALVAYVALYVAEDRLRASNALAADLFATGKLLVVCAWSTVAWRCSTNVDTRAWTTVARTILVLAVGATAATL